MLGRRNAVGLALVALLASGWHAAPAHSASLPERWHDGDEPPDVEGIHLGDTRERVLAVLGQPDSGTLADDPDADLKSLIYRDGALLIALDKSNTVVRVMLRRAEGGSLAGIRVGDRLGAMLIAWGEPTQSRGSLGRYQIGIWTITARVDFGEQKVLRLMLARTPNPPPTPPPAATPDTSSAAGTPQPAQ